SAVEGVRAYEIAVFRLEPERVAIDEEVFRRRFPATLSWTPSEDECLPAGRYGWVVRAQNSRGWSAWSEPSLFEVPAAARGAGPRAVGEEERLAIPSLFAAGVATARPSAPTEHPASEASRRIAEPAFAPELCLAGTEVFPDVPASHPFCGWIRNAYRDGIV